MKLNLKLSTISWAIVIGLLVSGLGYSSLLYLSGESVSVIQSEVGHLNQQLAQVDGGEGARSSVSSI